MNLKPEMFQSSTQQKEKGTNCSPESNENCMTWCRTKCYEAPFMQHDIDVPIRGSLKEVQYVMRLSICRTGITILIVLLNERTSTTSGIPSWDRPGYGNITWKFTYQKFWNGDRLQLPCLTLEGTYRFLFEWTNSICICCKVIEKMAPNVRSPIEQLFWNLEKILQLDTAAVSPQFDGGLSQYGPSDLFLLWLPSFLRNFLPYSHRDNSNLNDEPCISAGVTIALYFRWYIRAITYNLWFTFNMCTTCTRDLTVDPTRIQIIDLRPANYHLIKPNTFGILSKRYETFRTINLKLSMNGLPINFAINR